VAEVDTVLSRVCVQRESGLARLREAGDTASAAQARVLEDAWTVREGLLQERVLRSEVTDGGATFAFDSVAPGRYRVWADAVLNGERWAWLPRVQLRGGDTLRVNLSNGNVESNPFKCRFD
jgi:hypothetical protein